ncbi:MAG TPA: DinB family protein [Puia sp.]
MKPIIAILLLLAGTGSSNAQNANTMTLKEQMLKQLKTTHNQEEWFAPLNAAIEGLTPAQANWKQNGADHSIAELTTHIIFWNSERLAKFMDQPPPAFSGNNDETFSAVSENDWPVIVKRADSVLAAWEKAIEGADETKLAQWYETIGHISTHNAYHTGQIVYIRKVQGSWNPAKGVK